ncbi:MAG: hypothetical protein Q9M94_05910 [Candidatus Gracilibacteria bacterium]|nr:hypothetical protein [Candidatus Gracilibacteria bacterium]
MSEKIDFFKGKEKEVTKELTEKGYNAEEIKKALEQIKQKENAEAINTKLESLEAGSEDHIKYLETFLKKEKESITEEAKSKINKVKNTVSDKVDEKIEEAKNGIMDKLGITAIMAKFNGFTDKISGMFDSIWAKVTAVLAGTTIGAWLGFKKEEPEEVIKEDTKEKDNTKADDKKETPKIEDKIPVDESKKEETESEEKTKTPEKSPETKKEIKYKASIKTMLSLSGLNINKSKTKNPIFKTIKEQNYNELINLGESEKAKFLEKGGKKETLNKIIEQFKSDKFITVANYSFQKDFIDNIISKNPKIYEEIDGGKDRLNNIQGFDKTNSDWWQEKLTIAEISLFYRLSFSLLTIPLSEGIKDIKSGLSGLFFNKKEVEKLDNNLISKNIITNFTKDGLTNFGGNDFVKKNKQTREKIGENLNDSEKEQLDKLIDFKDYILGEYLEQTKPKIEGEQKIIFEGNLTYGHIIAIYSIMGGKKKVSSESVINRLSLNYINSKILGPLEGATYLGKIAYEILFKTDTDIFTEDEIKVLSIYKDKFLQMAIGYNMTEIGKKLNFLSSTTNTDLNKLALGLGIGGTTSYLLGVKIIKGAIEKGKLSFFGAAFKKLGIIGTIGGIAIGGYSFNNTKSNITIGEDIKNAGGDAEKIIKILEKYNDSIKNYPIDGKNISVIKYENDTPLILMDKKVYTFSIVDGPIIEKIKKIDSLDETVKVGKDILKNVASGFAEIFFDKSGKITINGEIINSGDIKINNDTITFGKNNSFTLYELFEGISNKKTEIDKSILLQLKDFSKENLPKYNYSKIGGSKINFIKLKELGEGEYLSLVQIGETNPQKNGK